MGYQVSKIKSTLIEDNPKEGSVSFCGGCRLHIGKSSFPPFYRLLFVIAPLVVIPTVITSSLRTATSFPRRRESPHSPPMRVYGGIPLTR